MRILDQIAINRLISIITNFILGLLKIFAPKSVENIDIDKSKKKKKLLPWRNNDKNNK